MARAGIAGGAALAGELKPHRMRTQVGIIGAGPAGLMLAHLLHLAGVESIVLETHSRDYVEERIRAGVIEQWVRELLIDTGVGERMAREGLIHHGIELRFNGGKHRIDFADLTDGRGVTVYGQQEVVKDLIAARLAAGAEILFEAKAESVHELASDAPYIRYSHHGQTRELACAAIAGCDGFHGICRSAIPAGVLTEFERVYPFGWLGILAQAPPVSEELIYANHDRGFALQSMRSPEISRLYVQCDPEEDLSQWPDERVWRELQQRLHTEGDSRRLAEGPVLQKGVTAMRSFVVEPMQYGRLFLAGDAAHIVPPTGAKGMNLAIADVWVLARAFAALLKSGRRELLESYSETCLRRIWKAQRFSWWMTSLLHRFEEHNAFDRRRQLAELDYISSSRAAATSLAENYVGLPIE
jgi:p-hydroxybenzoate 3-monooxygenase